MGASDEQRLEALRVLGDRMRGAVVMQGSPDYDRARRIWNGRFDARPHAVVRCAGEADVVQVLAAGRELDLPFVVRGGGHSLCGASTRDEGLVIDLEAIADVHVDRERMTARIGAGARWGEVHRVAHEHGLAIAGGPHPQVGVAGFTLGGGIGPMARSHGLAADNLVSAEVVLADGRIEPADEARNADLFWALRGGGAPPGIVTSFEFRVHEAHPRVAVAQARYPLAQARDALLYYRDFCANAPSRVACYATFVRSRAIDGASVDAPQGSVISLDAMYMGDAERGRSTLRGLVGQGAPVSSGVEVVPRSAVFHPQEDPAPPGGRYYWTTLYLDEISDGAIETVVDQMSTLPGAFTACGFDLMGGAVGRIGAAETAYPHRSAACTFSVFCGWKDAANDARMVQWAKRVHDVMLPHSTGGVYVNTVSGDVQNAGHAAYLHNLPRLARVRAKYDPSGLFESPVL